MKLKILNEIQKSIDIKNLLLKDSHITDKLETLAIKCIESLNLGGKIIFYGNGGSFADAQHLSAEFTSRFLFERPGLASLALGTNSSSMTAIGNDYGYENIFSREIESIADIKDVLIGITTSGNSMNVIKALKTATDLGLTSFILTGESGGNIPKTDFTINVPSSDTARIQECHILIGHILCGIVEDSIYGSSKRRT